MKPGDRIAAPRQLRVDSREAWPKHELIVLAGLLSEGNTCHPSTLYFYNNDARLVDDFVRAVNQFPDTVARVVQRENARFVVSVNTGRGARFVKGQWPWNARSIAHSHAVDDLPGRSGAYAWAEQLGILNCKATTKRVPECVFRLRDEDIELFLGRLWSGDGFVANATNFVPFYATSSRELARDVQTLLSRLGIISGIHEKGFKYRGEVRPGWTVHLVGSTSIAQFVRLIAPHIVGRDAALVSLKRRSAGNADHNFADTVPVPVRHWVNHERLTAGLTWKQLGARTGVAMREFAAFDAAGKHGFRRSTVLRLGSFLESEQLQAVATSDVFWDRIVSIQPAGEQPIYDLTVEVDHNFVADGLIVHNSHAFCYALVAFQTAYLKANYPVEWFAAVLSTIAADTDKIVGVVGECRRLGVRVLAPDVNSSNLDCGVETDAIRFGLGAIKNVGGGAVEMIVREREASGAYASLEEFCRRQDLHTVNKRVLESLIKCGAMDALGSREALLDSKRLDSAIAAAQIDQRAASTGQTSLFDMFGEAEPVQSPMPSVVAPVADGSVQVSTAAARERALWEKEVLGFQFGDHPFMEAAAWLAATLTHDTTQLTTDLSGEKIKIGGLVTGVRRILTKTKSQMAVITLEDLHGSIEAVVFPRVYERSAEVFREDAILVIEGRVDTRGERPQVVVDRAEVWTPPAEGTPPPPASNASHRREAPSPALHRPSIRQTAIPTDTRRLCFTPGTET